MGVSPAPRTSSQVPLDSKSQGFYKDKPRDQRAQPKSKRAMKEKHNLASKNRYLFTSESVTEGHPDKIAD